MDQIAVRIEGTKQPSFIVRDARMYALQRILGYEKNNLHRAVVPPKAHGTPRGVIKAAVIRKNQSHGEMLFFECPALSRCHFEEKTAPIDCLAWRLSGMLSLRRTRGS